MYLHLGQSVVVQQSSVIRVFDMDNNTSSYKTREFLRSAEKKGEIISVFDDLPKSFVVCKDENGVKIYLSQLSTATLLKRSEGLGFDV